MITKSKLRELRIINSWDIAKISDSKIFISYSGPTYGRGPSNANWQVIGIGFKTDPEGPWYNYGRKTFNIWGVREDKKPQLAEAIKWASEIYGITKWEKDPFGDYQVEGATQKAVRIKGGD